MGDNYGNIPDESPLSKPNTVNRIRVGYTIALNLPNPAKAIPLAYTESGKIIAAEAIGGSVGKGRLFVMNTMRTFYDGNIAGYVEYVDNKNFIRNLMEHIKGKFDLTLLRVKPKGTNLYSGDKFTCIAKVKNLGDKVSDAVKLEFYITDDGSLEDPSAPQKIKMVKRVDVEPLDPGKSRLIKAEAKLPSWLGAGNYILVAKLDPKGVSDDSQTANNLKVGKKKLKIKE